MLTVEMLPRLAPSRTNVSMKTHLRLRAQESLHQSIISPSTVLSASLAKVLAKSHSFRESRVLDISNFVRIINLEAANVEALSFVASFRPEQAI
jgi:hypothetical protein